MWKDSSVCGGRRGLRIFIRDLSEYSKSLDRKSTLVFEVPLMFWECSDSLLLLMVQPNLLATVSWSFSLMGSNEALYIYPRELKLSAKTRICIPDTNLGWWYILVFLTPIIIGGWVWTSNGILVVCTSSMPGLCSCNLRWHTYMSKTIVWLFGR